MGDLWLSAGISYKDDRRTTCSRVLLGLQPVLEDFPVRLAYLILSGFLEPLLFLQLFLQLRLRLDVFQSDSGLLHATIARED